LRKIYATTGQAAYCGTLPLVRFMSREEGVENENMQLADNA